MTFIQEPTSHSWGFKMPIRKLTKGPRRVLDTINQLIDFAQKSSGSLGTGRVASSSTAGGIVNEVSMTQLKPRIPKHGNPIGTGIGIVRRARTTEAATNNSQITCNIYNQNGVEQTSGDEAGVEVHCSIMNETALNEAAPRLEDNDDLFVVSLPNSSSTVRWYCVSLFQKARDCS